MEPVVRREKESKVVLEKKEQLDQMIWSFTRCHLFEGCKYEWYMNYLLRDEEGNRIYENEQNFYAAFGNFCHEILQDVLSEKMSLDEAVEYYQNEFDPKIQCWDVPESTREKYFYLGLDYFATLNFDWLEKYEILGIEKECRFEIDGIKFVGYIDLLIRGKDSGKIIIIDHKSSEYPLGKRGQVLKKNQENYISYKRQLYLYSQQIFNEYGEYPTEIWWNYFRDQKWIKLPFDSEEFEEAKRWAINVIQDVYKEENFLPKMDYFYCNNLCGFRNSCDYKLMGIE